MLYVNVNSTPTVSVLIFALSIYEAVVLISRRIGHPGYDQDHLGHHERGLVYYVVT